MNFIFFLTSFYQICIYSKTSQSIRYGVLKWHSIQWWHSHLFASATNPMWRSNFTEIPFYMQIHLAYAHTHSKCIENHWTVKCQLLIANRTMSKCEKNQYCKVLYTWKFSRELNWIGKWQQLSKTEYTLEDLVSIKLGTLMCEIFSLFFILSRLH